MSKGRLLELCLAGFLVGLLLVSGVVHAQSHYSHSWQRDFASSCTDDGNGRRVCPYRCIYGGELMWR